MNRLLCLSFAATLALCGCSGSGDDTSDPTTATASSSSAASASTASATTDAATALRVPGNAVQFTARPASTTVDRYAQFAFAAPGGTQATLQYRCQLDGGTPYACTSPVTLMPLAATDVPLAVGSHTFAVQAGTNGRYGPASAATWTIESITAAAESADPLVAGTVLTTTTQVPPDYVGTTPETDQTPYLQGIARFQCLESHVAYDDPLVDPDQPGVAHLHSFWGNTGSDAYSSAESLFTTGDSTCQGGTLNRSGYWVPVMLAPSYTQGTQTAWQVVPKDADDNAIAAGLFHETYYYSAVVTDVSKIQAAPVGLRMIAGSSSATAEAPADDQVLDDSGYVAHWYCAVRGSSPGRMTTYYAHIPECGLTYDSKGRENTLVHFVVRFPSCWDGVNLDVADHKSHMAYPVFGTNAQGRTDKSQVVCPADHPVPIPEVSYHYSFTVTASSIDPVTRTSKGWRLASDNYVVGTDAKVSGGYAYGGASIHGDWFNNWHPEAMQAFVDGCLKARKDCSGGELGAATGDGTDFVLGTASRAADPIYPAIPFPDDLAGMPDESTASQQSVLTALPAGANCKGRRAPR